MRFCFTTLIALMLLSVVAAGQTPNAAAGKTLYAAHQCWACHGSNGETDVRFIQENGTFIRRLQTVEEFTRFIRAPRPSEPPPAASSKSMPSYGVASLSDRDAADLWAYIKSLPVSPDAKDIPLLARIMRGK